MSASLVQSVEQLDVDNYVTWKTKTKCLLIMKGLWGAVTGESTDATLNSKAMAQIGLCVKDHHLPVLERFTTAKAVWDHLEAVYQAKSNARKRQLRKELAQLQMGTLEPLTKYVARAKDIQNQLRAAGYAVADQEVAWALLAGLPRAYETAVTVLETSTDADISLDDILPKLMSVEQRLAKTDSARPSETALAAQRKSGIDSRSLRAQHSSRRCYVCGQKGHIARDCLERRDRSQQGSTAVHYSTIAL